jgi:cyclopropane fatty-acyl-phospholipid synthase-like methyltransferase
MKIPAEVESLYIAIGMYEEQGDGFIARYYDSQAGIYDNFLRAKKYVLAENIAKIAFDEFGHGEGMRCMDVGCGTGEVGIALAKTGVKFRLDGLDISEEMLKVTEEKAAADFGSTEIYKNLFVDNAKNINAPLLGVYDGVVSAGLFTTKHLGPSNMEHVLELLKSGGKAVISVKKSSYDEEGYEGELNHLEARNVISSIKQTNVKMWESDEYEDTAQVIVFTKI